MITDVEHHNISEKMGLATVQLENYIMVILRTNRYAPYYILEPEQYSFKIAISWSINTYWSNLQFEWNCCNFTITCFFNGSLNDYFTALLTYSLTVYQRNIPLSTIPLILLATSLCWRSVIDIKFVYFTERGNVTEILCYLKLQWRCWNSVIGNPLIVTWPC